MKFRVITPGGLASGHGFKLGAIVKPVAPDQCFPEHLTDYRLVTADTLAPEWIGYDGTYDHHIQTLEARDVEPLPAN